MNTKTFEKKYGNKGGISKLTELRSFFLSQKYIANVFGVSQQRVKQWMKIFFGQEYDPREDRRDAIMASMIEFASHNSFPDFRFAYRGTQYYEEILKECIKLKIYEK